MSNQHDGSYLKRLSAEHYRGQAFVHWSMTMRDRKQGWLKPIVFYKFRELLTHAMFRYGLCCPIFVLMPDHIHMMWVGVLEESDQLPAMKHFRRCLNGMLTVLGFKLQDQAYENVLKDDQRLESAFQETCEYIARNPERAELVHVDGYAGYSYSGCLVPGYPDLKPFAADFWPRFWRIYRYLNQNGLLRISNGN